MIEQVCGQYVAHACDSYLSCRMRCMDLRTHTISSSWIFSHMRVWTCYRYAAQVADACVVAWGCAQVVSSSPVWACAPTRATPASADVCWRLLVYDDVCMLRLCPVVTSPVWACAPTPPSAGQMQSDCEWWGTICVHTSAYASIRQHASADAGTNAVWLWMMSDCMCAYTSCCSGNIWHILYAEHLCYKLCDWYVELTNSVSFAYPWVYNTLHTLRFCKIYLLDLVCWQQLINQELKWRPIYECRWDERLKTKVEESTRLTYTGLLGELGHLKIKTRLIDEKFASVMGECVI
jgi:hypothetical protein